MPVDSPILPGQTSCALRIVSARYTDDAWTFEFEGLSGHEYPIVFYTDKPPLMLKHARITDRDSEGVTITTSAPADGAQSGGEYVGWNAIVSWKE